MCLINEGNFSLNWLIAFLSSPEGKEKTDFLCEYTMRHCPCQGKTDCEDYLSTSFSAISLFPSFLSNCSRTIAFCLEIIISRARLKLTDRKNNSFCLLLHSMKLSKVSWNRRTVLELLTLPYENCFLSNLFSFSPPLQIIIFSLSKLAWLDSLTDCLVFPFSFCYSFPSSFCISWGWVGCLPVHEEVEVHRQLSWQIIARIGRTVSPGKRQEGQEKVSRNDERKRGETEMMMKINFPLFGSPWVNLGEKFDREDRNKESISRPGSSRTDKKRK